jgi:hypothetical protein
MMLMRKLPLPTNNPTNTEFRPGSLPLKNSHILLLIFLAALCLRVLNVFAFRAAGPMFNQSIPMLDMYQFQKWILNIVDTRWVYAENTPFWQAPLYAYSMAFVMQIFGKDILWVKLAQALTGSLNCLLIYLVGKKTFNARVRLLAALLACFYGMFFLYEATLLRDVSHICFFAFDPRASSCPRAERAALVSPGGRVSWIGCSWQGEPPGVYSGCIALGLAILRQGFPERKIGGSGRGPCRIYDDSGAGDSEKLRPGHELVLISKGGARAEREKLLGEAAEGRIEEER